MHAALQTWTDCNGYNNIDDIPCWSTYVESTTTWQSFRGRFYMSDDPTVAFVRPFVCPSVAYIANNSRTQRPSLPRFGRKVPHLRCYSRTSFKVKRSKVKVTRSINADTHRAPYLPNGKAYELQSWYTDGGQRPASATGAMTSKICCSWSRSQDHAATHSMQVAVLFSAIAHDVMKAER